MAVLHVEFVGAAVAAADDDYVHLGDVDHGHRIVDGRMDDIDRAVGETLALPFRAFGEGKLDLQPAPGEETAVDCNIKWQ